MRSVEEIDKRADEYVKLFWESDDFSLSYYVKKLREEFTREELLAWREATKIEGFDKAFYRMFGAIMKCDLNEFAHMERISRS